jgi:hypothetical protein
MDQTDGTDYIDQINEIISCLCTNTPLGALEERDGINGPISKANE